eukprot:Gb_07380 [translate_table: standard]
MGGRDMVRQVPQVEASSIFASLALCRRLLLRFCSWARPFLSRGGLAFFPLDFMVARLLRLVSAQCCWRLSLSFFCGYLMRWVLSESPSLPLLLPGSMAVTEMHLINGYCLGAHFCPLALGAWVALAFWCIPGSMALTSTLVRLCKISVMFLFSAYA